MPSLGVRGLGICGIAYELPNRKESLKVALTTDKEFPIKYRTSLLVQGAL